MVKQPEGQTGQPNKAEAAKESVFFLTPLPGNTKASCVDFISSSVFIRTTTRHFLVFYATFCLQVA
ncbi:MAG: hypothetical protein ACLQBD_08045, partial [Syntrophobacteraceae bacterium]